ncbi:MAG: hypothetical protein KIS73_07275 [Enhydrobacter sp.]|nr:hypothetical protein [Enhydrobacter sp.]
MLLLGTWTAAAAQDQPQGFASLDGGTRGGDPANVCTVAEESEKALHDAVKCTRSRPGGGVVIFARPSMTITLGKPLQLPSNITMQGPATIQSAARETLRIEGQSQIIVRDLVFRSLTRKDCPDPTLPTTVAARFESDDAISGCNTPIEVLGTRVAKATGTVAADGRDSTHVWIDHNSFSRCGDKCIVIKNGNTTNASGRWFGADLVTVSNNRFTDSFYSVLITVINKEALRGMLKHSTSECEAVKAKGVLPQMRISVYGNLFENIRRRSVRAAYCNVYVHQWNNVIAGFGMPFSQFPSGTTCSGNAFGFGPSSIYGSRLLLEANYIAAWPGPSCKNALNSGAGGRDESESKPDTEGYIQARDNLLVNDAKLTGRTSSVPPPPYSYTKLPADQAYASVSKNAGARGERR